MNAYTEKSNLLAKQRFYEEMAPNDLSRAFYIHKSGSVIGWRIVRQGGAVLSYDAGNRSFAPFDVLPEDKAVNLVPYDYIGGKITAVNESVRAAGERPKSFYLGHAHVLQTPDGFMCQLPGAANYVPFRTDIRDIKEGDAFAVSSGHGQVCVAARDSHQNLDEPDEPRIVYDSHENGWFEEDILTDPYTSALFQLPEHYFRKEIASLATELKDTSEHLHEVMKFVTRCDEVELVHVTTEDRLGSILETGIRPSAYGDMAGVGDDGAGVYAIRNDARLIRKVLDAVVATETLGYVYAVKFRYKGQYVECVDSVEHSSQGGYILIPKAACPHGIPAKDIIGYIRLTPQEQSVEKASLGDQIRQAEARTTPINAEKETHNIEQDRR